MKVHLPGRFFIAFNCLFFLLLINKASPQAVSPVSEKKKPASEKKLFAVDEVLSITLRGNMRELLNDRTETPKDFPLILSYFNKDKTEIFMPVQVKTRGHFRRLKENCSYPPLLIQFPKEGTHLSSVFRDQKKMKLVMPCRQDEYVIREWLVYKLYNLVTPQSFKARLVLVTLEDTKNRKPSAPFYGVLLEEEKQMAKRNKLVAVTRTLRPERTQREAFLRMAVFEYLIGNTDWSVPFLHNIKLLAKDSLAVPVTVPYDFDHSGIVNSPYAKPAEQLQMSSVRQRRYRGYCVPDMKVFEDVIEYYNSLEKDIYCLYGDCTLLDEKYRKSTFKYLDEFYTTINNPKSWQKEFGYPCSNAQNIVIRGLKKD